MLKVIIADDEVRVCRLIQMLADWKRLGMEVAGTAANGLEALELIRMHQPDILITDLRMPGCHGLELIQRAKEEYPLLEIVVISGYAHFEYAQSAIRFGVGDYLLKPIQREELMETLEKLGARCRQRRQSVTEVEQLRQSSQQDVERLQGRLMLDLAHHRLESPDPQYLRGEYHVELGPGLLQVVVLKLDYSPAGFSEQSLSVIREKTEQIFRGELGPVCGVVLLAFRESWGYGLLNYPTAQKDAVRKRLRNALNQISAQRALYGEIEFAMALGSAVEQTEQLPRSVREAELAVSERLTEGTGRLLERLPERSGIERGGVLEQYRRTVSHGIDTLDFEEIDGAAAALWDQVQGETRVRGRELLELVQSAGKIFLLRTETEAQAEVFAEFERQCDQCSRAEQLLDCLRAFQRRELASLEQRRHNDSIRPIRIAKQYIQKNYGHSITLEDVCEATGFSPSYFSALFKKETGEGFAKYLTRVRMDKAKELLQQTNLPVTEICTQVGYSDLKHFTQTFKKATNLNPGQYRKLYG